LAESDLQHRYRMLFEHSPRMVYITSREGRIVDANPAFFKMFGIIDRADLANWNALSFYEKPHDRLRMREALERDGQVEDFAVRLRDAKGRIRECLITSSVWRNEAGEVMGYQGLISDVTNVHQLERELRDSVERYNLLARATNDVIYDWNMVTGTVEWNDALFSVFRYQPSDVETTLDWWSANVHPADYELVHDSLQEMITTARDAWSEEYRFRRGDGSYATVLDRGSVVRSESGEPLRMIGSMVDLTDQKAAEAERHQLEEQLRQAQKMEAIGKLAGGIAHDFNNLLTAVRGNAELLLEADALDADVRDGLQEIAKAADRAASLTRQLLAFSRRQVLQPRIVDVNRVVIDMEKMLARLIGEHITLLTALDPTIAMIKADPSQIEQVILNLTVNARDAMPNGGMLTIQTGEAELTESDRTRHSYITPGRYVRLMVRDNGVGMERETLDRAFEPFFTTKEPGKGTGLGLSTVYGVVKQSGGYIWAESHPAGGTEFRIYLPAVSEDADLTAQRTAAVPHARVETVLVVEDESSVRSLVRRILERRGYNVLTAENGVQALELVSAYTDPIALVITDVVMPNMGGRELSLELAQLRPELRILYMSGYTEDEVVRHGVNEQAVSFISKPFSSDALLDKIRSMLDKAAT
jgi:two-component system, cell cycle sensor histidine kinase and response regulator CckA